LASPDDTKPSGTAATDGEVATEPLGVDRTAAADELRWMI
jgi:hypothetical protein